MLTPDDEMRRVLDAAQAEADRQKAPVTPAHLLLGLFCLPVPTAGRALLALGVEPKREKLTGIPDETTWPPPIAGTFPAPPRRLRLSQEAGRVLALAEREARLRSDPRLTPAHLVIGLLEFRSGSAYLLLWMHQITTDVARQALYPVAAGPRADDLAGPTGAPAIVFLHAASYTRQMWLPQVRALEGEYRILTLDLPAHGARAEQPFSFAASVQTVADTMAGAGVERALLVGTSLGGCVGALFAAAHPEAVAGLVLSGSTFDARRPVSRLVLTGESLVFPFGATWFTRAFHRSVRRRFPDEAEAIIAAGAHWPGASQAVRAMRGLDFAGALTRYPGPTLILNGRRDWVHRTAEQAYARAARNARVQTLAGAGHMANLDQPEAFTAAVRAFARTLDYTYDTRKLVQF